ncbi:hypothetical protein ACLOJK_003398 [Asimina triloba]
MHKVLKFRYLKAVERKLDGLKQTIILAVGHRIRDTEQAVLLDEAFQIILATFQEGLMKHSRSLGKTDIDEEEDSDVEMDSRFWHEMLDLYFIRSRESRGRQDDDLKLHGYGFNDNIQEVPPYFVRRWAPKELVGLNVLAAGDMGELWVGSMDSKALDEGIRSFGGKWTRKGVV